MHYSFDGSGLSQEQLQAKVEAAQLTGQLDGDSGRRENASPKSSKPNGTCDWRGDAPEPELDDLAHACEKNQQQSIRMDACDWRGDVPEEQKDNLDRICQTEKQAKQSGRRDKPAEQADTIHMPMPRLPQVDEIPEILRPSEDDKSFDLKPVTKPLVAKEAPARDKGKPERGKRPKKPKERAESSAAPASTSPRANEGDDESPTGDKTHSPWVDSLEQMPSSVIEKVNSGIKHTLEGAISMLTSRADEQRQSPKRTAEEKTTGSTSLAPETVAQLPSELYVPSPPLQPTEPPPENDRPSGSKKQEREKKRAEKKARHEAKRRARQQKNKERKEKRRQAKERSRKEKQWKKAAKFGGELPPQILQGLRVSPGSKTTYNSNCDICMKSAASIMSSKERNPKCTTCAKAAERESTQQYLKASNIDLGNLPSFTEGGEILGLLRNILEQHLANSKSKGKVEMGGEKRIDEGLVRHMVQHIQDFITSGREAELHSHECSTSGQPGHLGRHGLDGNRDSPASTESAQIISSSSQNSDATASSNPVEVDWWVQAMSLNGSPPSPYRPLSPRSGTPLPRPRTAAVYGPGTSHYPLHSPFDMGHAAYHFYLPLPICHGFCPSPGQYDYHHRYSVPIFPQPAPFFSPEQKFNKEVASPVSGLAETVSTDTPRLSRDYHVRSRSRSGSI
ncbi:hypothetical protein F5B22DRAFT_383266 [Xylaria bambusicola]|uniref:uncharacterized protein n=1 Tax=Xylaria bambusicola TaxID=326684 RepID=UPI002007C1A4|nr:uncharacterized protein F5B22DRAFT_383266 [Xylaria bambusicola]KAI0508770.1 hypothetical protein F5B22DRAFT_383266 [Xylaria bambusicola]